MPHAALPPSLLALLDDHGTAHLPRYPPCEHSDHGPMAYLAMHGLGLDQGHIERFAQHYRRRLAPWVAPGEALDRDTWHLCIGDPTAYPAFLRFFAHEMTKRGPEATLARYLPELASGWVRELFHPLIRLAYGIEFALPDEMAAGLAFLASAGDDPRLALAARFAPVRKDARAYLEGMRGRVRPEQESGLGSFNERYRHAVEGLPERPLAPLLPGSFAELTRACVEVFDSTHDFFALHLVTGSHAFRTCAPWIGEHAAGLFSVGLGAAYVALGAPRFSPIKDAPRAHFDRVSLAEATDEHDIKLAYSCRSLERLDADRIYEWVLLRYLTPRLKASSAPAG